MICGNVGYEVGGIEATAKVLPSPTHRLPASYRGLTQPDRVVQKAQRKGSDRCGNVLRAGICLADGVNGEVTRMDVIAIADRKDHWRWEIRHQGKIIKE